MIGHNADLLLIERPSLFEQECGIIWRDDNVIGKWLSLLRPHRSQHGTTVESRV